MATIKFLLVILCLTLTYSIGLLKDTRLNPSAKLARRRDDLRAALVQTAVHEIGVRELTGNNDGKRVETYLAVVGLKKPEPWCAAFISFVFAQHGFKKPRSGWSPDLFPASRITNTALPADIIGIYFPDKGRIAHVGLVEKETGPYVSSIEGNTNVAGSREGDGVYRRLRYRRTIYKIADWVGERRKLP